MSNYDPETMSWIKNDPLKLDSNYSASNDPEYKNNYHNNANLQRHQINENIENTKKYHGKSTVYYGDINESVKEQLRDNGYTVERHKLYDGWRIEIPKD